MGRPGIFPGRDKLAQAVRATGTAGIDADALAQCTGLSRQYVRDMCCTLRRSGALVSAPVGGRAGRQPLRWWHRDYAAASCTTLAPPSAAGKPAPKPGTQRLVLRHDQPTIVPPGLTITHCPAYTPNSTRPACTDWLRDRHDGRTYSGGRG